MEPWFGNHGNTFFGFALPTTSLASMEPWFGNHGNAASTTRRARMSRLQWSRGSVTTETWQDRPRLTVYSLASMEPWFGNHGNQGCVRYPRKTDRASMEPWFGNHGN